MQKELRREQALEYHSKGRPGKIEVIPTKEAKTQRDLSLAYSPGVAEPCKEIAANKEDVYKYTAKGNLVAVISNGTAMYKIIKLKIGEDLCTRYWAGGRQTGYGRKRSVI